MSFSSFNENFRDKLHLQYHNEFKGCTVCCCGAFWELQDGVSPHISAKTPDEKKGKEQIARFSRKEIPIFDLTHMNCY